jgi:hypothetical protein
LSAEVSDEFCASGCCAFAERFKNERKLKDLKENIVNYSVKNKKIRAVLILLAG